MVRGVEEAVPQISQTTTTSMFQCIPTFVVILIAILLFIFLMSILVVIFYYIRRKFNAVDESIKQEKIYKDHKQHIKDIEDNTDTKIEVNVGLITAFVKAIQDTLIKK